VAQINYKEDLVLIIISDGYIEIGLRRGNVRKIEISFFGNIVTRRAYRPILPFPSAPFSLSSIFCRFSGRSSSSSLSFNEVNNDEIGALSFISSCVLLAGSFSNDLHWPFFHSIYENHRISTDPKLRSIIVAISIRTYPILFSF
jgi:hypothetical protein